MESEKVETEPKKREVKKPKPIMVTGITDIIEFTKNVSRGCEFEFEAKLSGSYLKILPNNLRNKMRIIEHFKQNNVQFYVVPDREIPIKAVIRGLPTSTYIDEIKEI